MTRPALIVVAQSARALAEAAARAGYAPIAVDFFADEDTRQAAIAAERYPGGLRCGFRRSLLMPALETAVRSAGADPVGIILGSGFEDRPRLIETIAARWPLIGCSPRAVAAAKDPFGLASVCSAAGIPHPEVRTDVPEQGEWLVRRRGASGGSHVRPWPAGRPVPAGHVVVERVPGRPVSATVLADSAGARIVAFAEQILAPTAEAPFRFAGVAGPIELPASVAVGLAAAGEVVKRAFGLRGLVSLDAMMDGDAWWLLEVNPRPGASLDVFDRAAVPLVEAHCRAVEGRAPNLVLADATIRATMVVYASDDSATPSAAVWPDWIRDRPAPASRIRSGEPIATVTAEAATKNELKERLAKRAEDLIELLRGHAT